MAIYMKFEGIDGESTAEGHEKWIDVMSVQWGTSRGLSSNTGTSQNREGTTTTISDLIVTKTTDDSTPYLFKESCIGSGKEVKIHVCKTGETHESYLEYTLTNCMISGYNVSSDGDRPMETIAFSFTKMELRYIPYDDLNKAGTPVSQIYDLTLGKMV